jgi:large repetitive protein
MTSTLLHRLLTAGILLVCAALVACGGSSSSGGPPPPPPPPPSLTITDTSPLPGTLQFHAYSVTLHAAHAVGAVSWSIAPISSTASFVDGLTIDPATGVLSGTANFGGTCGFVASVTDSSSPPRTAHKTFLVNAASPLQPPSPQSFTVQQFQDVFPFLQLPPLAGVQPLSFSVTGGALPPGIRLNGQNGQFAGSATHLGSYVSTVTIQDSFSPPEVVTAQVTIRVDPPQLQLPSSLPSQILRNRPFSGRAVAVGGIPPYKFTLSAGSLPPGFSPIELNTGRLSGTPTTLGNYFFAINVSDSSTPPQQTGNNFSMNVVDPIGRNDTIATATPIVQDGLYSASISPYIDPPDNAPLVADNDYYKLVAVSGSTVHVETQAQRWQPANPVDTVIEVVDGNGTRQSTCRLPGSTAATFTSACIDDDIGGTPYTLDSALDFKVPGAASTPTTFYVHVLDWRGDARPDMFYALQISGAVSPLTIQTTSLAPAARTKAYSQNLTSQNGTGTITWSLAAGNLPPGLMIAANGLISGTATTNGTYPFTVQASDASNPPQTTTAQESIQVVNPVNIVSAATWPDACVNQPYSFTLQTSGGLAPFYWSFFSSNWVAINLNQSTGIFSGTADVTGTFMGTIGVNDATGQGPSQNVTLTVKQCP